MAGCSEGRKTKAKPCVIFKANVSTATTQGTVKLTHAVCATHHTYIACTGRDRQNATKQRPSFVTSHQPLAQHLVGRARQILDAGEPLSTQFLGPPLLDLSVVQVLLIDIYNLFFFMQFLFFDVRRFFDGDKGGERTSLSMRQETTQTVIHHRQKFKNLDARVGLTKTKKTGFRAVQLGQQQGCWMNELHVDNWANVCLFHCTLINYPAGTRFTGGRCSPAHSLALFSTTAGAKGRE